MEKETPELPERLQKDLAVQHEDCLTARFLHCVNPGDLIAAMGAMKKYYEITKQKVIVCQSINQPAAYYTGAVHPTVDETGQNVCCNLPMWNNLKPLIEHQEYVHSFEQYNGQKVDLDLNIIRTRTNVNLPHGSIQGWIPLAFPDLAFDISKAWMEVRGECPPHIKEQIDGKVIINFTERYRNHFIDYFFLKNYAPDLIFAGTEREHWLFCNRWQLNIPRLEVNDFLELGYAIRDCRFIFANQSMCINIAYALGTPRVVEICSYAQNVIHMIGEDCFGFLFQTGAEYYFRRLYNQTIKKASK